MTISVCELVKFRAAQQFTGLRLVFCYMKRRIVM